MAAFLLSVPYPPAQRRAYTNEVSEDAERGFKLFHIENAVQHTVFKHGFFLFKHEDLFFRYEYSIIHYPLDFDGLFQRDG